MDDAVGYRNLQVNARYILGYGLPDYARKAGGHTASSSAPTGDKGTMVHTVEKNESLWELADRYLGNGLLYPQIMAANNLTTIWIYPGMQLKIPNSGKTETVTPETGGDSSGRKTCTPTLPKLSKGDKGQAVKSLQTLLILHGHKLPTYGVVGISEMRQRPYWSCSRRNTG